MRDLTPEQKKEATSLDKIKAIPDPAERAEAAVAAMERAASYQDRAREVRDRAIYELVTAGKKPFAVAQKLRLSKSTIVSVVRVEKAKADASR